MPVLLQRCQVSETGTEVRCWCTHCNPQSGLNTAKVTDPVTQSKANSNLDGVTAIVSLIGKFLFSMEKNLAPWQ